MGDQILPARRDRSIRGASSRGTTVIRPPSNSGEAFAWAERVASTWYLDGGGKDRMAFDGLEVGPTMLIEAFDSILDLTRRLGGESGAPGQRIFRALKRRGIDRSARAWSFRVTVGIREGRWEKKSRFIESQRAQILFVSDLSTPSTLEPSMLVAQTLPAGTFLVATADPRSHRAWRRVGYVPRPLVLSLAEERRILATTCRAARAAWESFVNDPPAFAFRGRDVTGEILRALRPLVLRSVPWLAVERRALERTLESAAPRCVVVASDQHRIGRLAATLRSGDGWRLVVLQHGLPQDAIGFVPVIADTVAVWSRSSTEWFMSQGTDPGRLVETGNPRLDPLVHSDRSLVASATAFRIGLTGRPRLLLALSGLSSMMTAAAARLAVDALKLMPEATLIIKLHPGGGDWRSLDRIVAEIGEPKSRVRVIDRERLDPLLSWADLVLVHRSSVAMEALAAGTPVAVADLDGKSIADLELAGLDLPRVTSASAVAATAHRLAQESERLSYLAERRSRLESIAGPLDGLSANRIAALLLRPT